MNWIDQVHVGDCRTLLPQLISAGVRARTCVTSPPYFGLRDYGHAEQIGLEPSPDAYVAELVKVFRLVRDALADDGTLWLNLGDSYAGSWGAQGRQGESGQMAGRSVVSARQIKAHPQRTSKTGSLANLGGLKQKDLIGIPWRTAFALQADGWYLRSDIIWSKPNPMPESVTDRPTKAHEYLFLLAKSERYYYDAAAIAEPSDYAGVQGGFCRGGVNFARARAIGREPSGNEAPGADWTQPEMRNRRTVWEIPPKPFPGAHFATFPPALIEPCILAGAAPGDIVLDPFMGSGTVGQVSLSLGRRFVGFELNPEYAAMLGSVRERQTGFAL